MPAIRRVIRGTRADAGSTGAGGAATKRLENFVAKDFFEVLAQTSLRLPTSVYRYLAAERGVRTHQDEEGRFLFHRPLAEHVVNRNQRSARAGNQL